MNEEIQKLLTVWNEAPARVEPDNESDLVYLFSRLLPAMNAAMPHIKALMQKPTGIELKPVDLNPVTDVPEPSTDVAQTPTDVVSPTTATPEDRLQAAKKRIGRTAKNKAAMIAVMLAILLGVGIKSEAQTNGWITNIPAGFLSTVCITNSMDLNYHGETTSELVTNWTTKSVTTPVLSASEQYDAVYRPAVLNQSGVIVSNTVATIHWNNNPIKVILESTNVGTISRQIDEYKLSQEK